jgi:hypothetical protein
LFISLIRGDPDEIHQDDISPRAAGAGSRDILHLRYCHRCSILASAIDNDDHTHASNAAPRRTCSGSGNIRHTTCAGRSTHHRHASSNTTGNNTASDDARRRPHNTSRTSDDRTRQRHDSGASD